jgi:hypothetical protein
VTFNNKDKAMPDRFDLENEITNLTAVSDDLVLLAGAVLEREEFSADELSNALLGLSVMVTLRSEKLFDIFKAVFQLDEYSPEMQKYTRE